MRMVCWFGRYIEEIFVFGISQNKVMKVYKGVLNALVRKRLLPKLSKRKSLEMSL